MVKKVALIALIFAGVVASILILTAIMPAINSMVDIAYNDPSAANYSEYRDAVGAAPIWLYLIPPGVGGVLVIMVLKKKY